MQRPVPSPQGIEQRQNFENRLPYNVGNYYADRAMQPSQEDRLQRRPAIARPPSSEPRPSLASTASNETDKKIEFQADERFKVVEIVRLRHYRESKQLRDDQVYEIEAVFRRQQEESQGAHDDQANEIEVIGFRHQMESTKLGCDQANEMQQVRAHLTVYPGSVSVILPVEEARANAPEGVKDELEAGGNGANRWLGEGVFGPLLTFRWDQILQLFS